MCSSNQDQIWVNSSLAHVIFLATIGTWLVMAFWDVDLIFQTIVLASLGGHLPNANHSLAVQL